jgi:hypothetical protein
MVIKAATAAITKLKPKLSPDRNGVPVRRGKRIRDAGIEAAKTTMDVNIMKAMYALNAISTPPFLS